ncbi:glycoside hydrolase family 93 protein [Periconia macrospinosa]|uniref:Glycoside hydrolase family 93 protein n=1 Tax=Periconia macrospinosa TaxID=97972 RepID=A0A2V1DPN8_9PLEO|nr:glycoside hydrolase family 93 protein [Periconia macrospinosa]
MTVKRILAVALNTFVLLATSTELPTIPSLQTHQSRSSGPAYSFTNRTTIYAPVNNQTVGYPRITELSDGSLLVACTLSGNYPGYFPIFKSGDGGVTWSWLSNVGAGGDPVGLGAQPSLLQLSQAFGDFPAGTILAAGNRMDMDSTNIDLYASKDVGKTWQFVSTIAQGGPPSTGDGGSSIWEPFLMEYKNTVVAYYSDSRDDNYSQKLSHQTSTNLIDWANPVNDVTYPNYIDRPGMSVVAYIPPLSKYMLVYEHGNGTRSSGGNNYPDSYKLAADPLLFDKASAIPIEAKDMNGTVVQNLEPGSAPYVVWSPVGGVNGTIVVTDANHRKLFINRRGGAEDGWETRDVAQPRAYARALHVLSGHTDHLVIVGAGPFRPKPGEKTPLSVSVVNLTALVEGS